MDESPVPNLRIGEYVEGVIKSECVTGYSWVKEETPNSLHFAIETTSKSNPCSFFQLFLEHKLLILVGKVSKLFTYYLFLQLGNQMKLQFSSILRT